ncbi:MAG: peptidoglycan recognition protein family protein, partial [Phycisphaerales bacterium]
MAARKTTPVVAQRAPVPVTGPAPGVLPRSAWTTSGVARQSEINPMNGVQRITVHHDGMDVFTSTRESDAAARIEMVRKSHVNGGRGNRKAFADIGYHYIIDPAGRIYEGRNIRYQGAHVQDNNENNLGVMCLGNYDSQRPTAATKSALDRFIAGQMKRYNIA